MLESLRRWVGWKLHSFQHDYLFHTHPLRYLFLELTRRCNLRCAYCGSDCAPAVAQEELTAEEWVRVVRQIAEDFDPREVMIAITGGEPLLVPDVMALFRELGRLGFRFGMVSNSTRITEETAREIVDSGMGSISLSMDAPRQLNDELRGEGTTRAVERAIENLRGVEYRGILEILSTLTKPAVPQLPLLREQLQEMGIERWRIGAVMPLGRAASREDLVLDGEDLAALLAFIKAARRDGESPAPEFGCECYLGEEFEGEVRPYLFRCRAGLTIGSVLSNGDISACPELGPDFVQGSIHEQRFREVWEAGFQSLRDRSWAWRGRCQGCQVWDRCRGGSMHLYPAPGADLMRCTHRLLEGS